MTYGSGHYWASEDLNTTGENVGITLDSMCDIIMANDVTSGNTVVFIPGDIEHGQKGYFALGEGGGGSAEIDASIYQVIVGDGEGNGVGAQGGAEAQEANKIYLKDKKFGPNIPTQEADGTYIQDVDTGSFTITSNALNHTHTETVYDEEAEEDVEIQVEDDGWRATFEDYGQLKVSGGATVHIGETGTVFEGNDRGKFWDKNLRGPEVDITACAKIEMIGNGQNNATPVLSMRGNCIIDIADESTASGTKTHVPHQINGRIRDGILVDSHSTQIFNYKDSRKSAPVLQLKDKGTASFTDLSVLSMRDSATVVLQGDCLVKITGGNYSDVPYDSYAHESGVLTYVNISPNSIVNIDGNPTTSIVHVGPKQMLLGTIGEITGRFDESELGGYSYMNNPYGSYTWSLTRGSGLDQVHSYSCASTYSSNNNYMTQNKFAIKKPVCDFDNLTTYMEGVRTGQISNVSGPGFIMEGRASLLLSSSETSIIKTIFEADDSALLSHIESINDNGHYSYHVGVDHDGNFSDNVLIQSGAKVFRRLSATGNCTLDFMPDSYTSIVLHTANVGINTNITNTDIQANWKKFQGIFDGNDSFMQVDGETHVESWGAKTVFRGFPNGPVMRVFSNNNGQYRPLFPDATTLTGEEGSSKRTFTSSQVLSFTKRQLIGDYMNWITAASPCPQSSDNVFNPIRFKDIDPYTVELTNEDGCYFDEKGRYDEIVTYEDRYFNVFTRGYYATQFTTVDEVVDYYNNSIATGGTVEAILNGWRMLSIEKTENTQFTKYYSNSRYQYQLRYVKVHRQSYTNDAIAHHQITDSTDLNANRIYDPATDPVELANLTQTQQDWFKSIPIKKLGYTSQDVPVADIDYANAKVAYSCDQYWKLTCVSLWEQSTSHLGKKWLPPLQTEEYSSNPCGLSPIVQMYGAANVLLRGKFQGNTYYLDIESTETYDITNQKQAIEDFIAGPDYATFEAEAIMPSGYELWKITKIEIPEAGTYRIDYEVKPIGWKEHLDSYSYNPVVEITDGSEARLYGGAKFKLETDDFGETIMTITGSTDEGSVSFTMDELKALKQMLNNN